MATRLAGVVNANLDTCVQSRRLTRSLCERLVRWIDECVAACHAVGGDSGVDGASRAADVRGADDVSRANCVANVKGDNSGNANTANSSALPEHFVEDVLLVVNQMTQKETFEALYRAMLFRHLVACQFGGCPSRVDHDVLLPEEMRIIDEIKAICGNVFVSRMDSLAKDSLASREFTAYLQQQPGGAQLLQQCQFHVVSKGGGVGDA